MDFHDDDDRILSDEELDILTKTSKTTRWRLRRDFLWPPYVELSPQIKGNTLGQIRQMLREKKAEAEARAKAGLEAEPRGPGRPPKIAMMDEN